MQFESWTQPAPAWSAKRFANGFVPPNITHSQQGAGADTVSGVFLPTNYTDTFGVGIITAMNSTHLQYSTMPITGNIGVDSFWIVKRV
jgi:hypothetical protein